MKPNTEINLKFWAGFFGFFALILFIPASDFIFDETFNFLKFINFEYCVSFVYGLIVIAAFVILFKVGKQIYNNLK